MNTLLGSGGKEIGFGRSVEGGEFWNLHVDVDAVVEPEDDEDDCREVDEMFESAGMFELLQVISWHLLLLFSTFMATASASCIRHSVPEILPPSGIEPAMRFV